ncbi:MAG: hypothetical protein HKP10_09175 [Kiritimatiellales bacterium]|nr:hypothetical protein [Kiritimatiellales bacterium]
MKAPLLLTTFFALMALHASAQYMRTFTSPDGKTLRDRIVKYDYQEKLVFLEEAGRVPLDSFSADDQAYILHWNQVAGFKSTMRFKMELKKSSWARMKHEQNITPFYMDAIHIPGKKIPNHQLLMLEDFEEYNAVYLEAEGYEIKLRNQNFFPIENIVVESKIYYEQENYMVPDSFFMSSDNAYDDTVATNKVRFLSETVPVIVPREEVFLNSECAIMVDHQIERSILLSTSENEGEGDDEGDTETEETVEGFGEWDDHSRRRKGKMIGAWLRVGIKDTNGQMVWREITSPSSLPNKVSWDPAEEPEEE